MNYRDYLLLDFETTSKFAHTTQPVQLAAVVIHGRKLQIKKGSEFNSLIRPVFDEDKCRELNLDPLTDEAISKHGKTRDMLENAPDLKSVWSNFVNYVNQHNYNKTAWNAPIMIGYNSENFDYKIIHRICCEEPWKFGPRDETYNSQSLFQPITRIDLMTTMFHLFENNKDVKSLSADNLLRGYMGWEDTVAHAHDALADVMMCAEVFCKTQRLFRDFVAEYDFKDILKAKA